MFGGAAVLVFGIPLLKKRKGWRYKKEKVLTIEIIIFRIIQGNRKGPSLFFSPSIVWEEKLWFVSIQTKILDVFREGNWTSLNFTKIWIDIEWTQ